MPTQLHRKDQTRVKAKKILVIEDERITLLVHAQMIKSAGYRVVTAADAAEALQAIRLEKPALILADVALNVEASGHEWDGFQVLEWLKYHYPEHRTEAIIVSAGNPEKIRRRALGRRRRAASGRFRCTSGAEFSVRIPRSGCSPPSPCPPASSARCLG